MKATASLLLIGLLVMSAPAFAKSKNGGSVICSIMAADETGNYRKPLFTKVVPRSPSDKPKDPRRFIFVAVAKDLSLVQEISATDINKMDEERSFGRFNGQSLVSLQEMTTSGVYAIYDRTVDASKNLDEFPVDALTIGTFEKSGSPLIQMIDAKKFAIQCLRQ